MLDSPYLSKSLIYSIHVMPVMEQDWSKPSCWIHCCSDGLFRCQTDGAGKIDQCSEPPEARCKFEQLKDTSRTQECTAYDQSLKYDVEQRHSVIEEAVANGLNKTDKAFKVMYLCKKNSCNDDSHTKGVHRLNPRDAIVHRQIFSRLGHSFTACICSTFESSGPCEQKCAKSDSSSDSYSTGKEEWQIRCSSS